MATKAELEAAHGSCELIRRRLSDAETACDFPLVVKHAETSLPYLHDSVSFQRRFLKSPKPTTPTVDVILRYAPPFFLSKALDAVQAWYDGGTKTERTTLPDMPKRIEAARKALAHAIQLWGVLAESPLAVLHPPATPLTKAIVPFWVAAGLVLLRPQTPDTYARVSDQRRPAVAKCSGCGKVRTALLVDLLEPATCHACKKRCAFVLIRRGL